MCKLSIILPCLNEEKTLGLCIDDIKKSLKSYKEKYEIIVVDNGSSDSSVKIANKKKVRVVLEDKAGYGNAIRKGIDSSNGEYIIMLDCDCSYDTHDLLKIIKYLEEADLVIGNRFLGEKTEKEAFPFMHKTGIKILNKFSNLLFNTKVKDFHCGLRGFRKNKIEELNLSSEGMELASEMVIKAKLNHLKIKQFNTSYFKDKRDGKSHLRTFRDGFRHLFKILNLKYESSTFFRFTSIFISTVLLLMILLFGSALFIPQNKVEKNVLESIKYLEDNGKYAVYNNGEIQEFYKTIDYVADMKTLNMAFLIDNENPISSSIEMNYYDNLNYKLRNFTELFENKDGKEVDYSRYWQGQIIFVRILLLFTNIEYMYIFNNVLIYALLIILLIKLFKCKKSLAFMVMLSLIVVNFYIVPFCYNYYFSFLVAFIASINIVDNYKKDKNKIEKCMIVSGICTCFFDFLTCETLALTLPLFIYVSLNKNEVSFKELFKLIILWGISYALTFALKWGIDCIHFGSNFIFDIFDKASIRVYTNDSNIIKIFIANLINVFSNLSPFVYFKNGLTIFISIILIAIYNLIFNLKDRKKYLKYFVIAMIPFIRFFVLSAHTYEHHYFTYRALIPFIILLCMIYKDIFNRFTKKS